MTPTTKAGRALSGNMAAAGVAYDPDAAILAIEAEAAARVRLGPSWREAMDYEQGFEAGAAAERERLRGEVENALPDVDYLITTLDGRQREMRTPADGAEAMRAAVLALIADPAEPEPSHRPVWDGDVPTGWCECGKAHPHPAEPDGAGCRGGVRANGRRRLVGHPRRLVARSVGTRRMTLDDLAAAAEEVVNAPNGSKRAIAEYDFETLVDAATVLRLVAVARAAQHQRDTRPGAQPQLVAALAALEEVR